MQYMLLLNETEAEFAKRMDPTASAEYWGGWNAFIGAMGQAGIIVKGDNLQGPYTATTVRIRDGKRLVEDGSFADTLSPPPDSRLPEPVAATLKPSRARCRGGAAGPVDARRPPRAQADLVETRCRLRFPHMV